MKIYSLICTGFRYVDFKCLNFIVEPDEKGDDKIAFLLRGRFGQFKRGF